MKKNLLNKKINEILEEIYRWRDIETASEDVSFRIYCGGRLEAYKECLKILSGGKDNGRNI